MNSAILLSIGKKVHEIRTSKKMKLVELAALANVSKGLLSQIENGRTIPSLPVLLQIIKALDIGYSTFFEGIENQPAGNYMLQRKENYTLTEKEEARGFSYFSILSGSAGNAALQFYILELEPDASREKVVTNGYTYLYLLQGKVDYFLDREILTLHEGDSLFFNGNVPHVPKNNSGSQVRMLVVYILSSEK
jgi:transcriptional regulator with XRE-family HTH domain